MQAEWIWGLAGGLMIGTATWLLFAGIGRIAGISGILFHAVQSAAPQNRWRWVFLAALLSGPWLLAAVGDGLPRYDAGSLGGAPLLVIAGLMLTCGALGDRYGRKRLLLIGLGLFGISSAAAAWAGSAALVIAARGVMGLGAAIMMPVAFAVHEVEIIRAALARILDHPLGDAMNSIVEWLSRHASSPRPVLQERWQHLVPNCPPHRFLALCLRLPTIGGWHRSIPTAPRSRRAAQTRSGRPR